MRYGDSRPNLQSRGRLFRALLAMMATGLAACASTVSRYDLLISNVTVVDPRSDTVQTGQCVAIDGDRIASVSSCTSDVTATTVIDGRGRWLLPGLWDMHVHALWDRSLYRPFFADFLAYGVIGVRDMASEPAMLAEVRDYLARPGVIAPRLFASGPVVDGPEPLMPGHAIAVSTAADARAAVTRLVAMEADFVKPYTLLGREAGLALLDEARQQGLPVAGHLPASLTARDAIDGGMASIEHMAVGVGGLCNVDDEPACRQLFHELTAAGVYLTPTLLVRQRRTRLDIDSLDEAARIDAMPPLISSDWRSRRERRLAARSPQQWEASRAQYVREQRLTELAGEEQALILAGTDAGELFIPPGLSLHDELELLVAAGLSEMEALRSASSRPASFLGLADYGRIGPGAIASLLLLDRNPLEDIRNSRSIAAVILDGQPLPRAAD